MTHPASLQPVSETTTSESSVSWPSSPSGSSSTESTSSSGTDSTSSSSETLSESSSQPSLNASSSEATTSASSSQTTSPELLRDGALFQHLARRYQREVRACHYEESNGQLERTTAVHHHLKASCHAATEPTKACLSASSSKHATPPYRQRHPSDMGSRNQVQAENANALCKNSSDSETGLQDIKEEPQRHIEPSRVKELAKFFTPSSDEEQQSHVNTRTRRKRLFEPKEKEGRNSEK